VALPRSALASDDCLSEEPGPAPEPTRAQRCFELSPLNCAAVLCLPQPPPSRIVESDGAGGCRFVDECMTADDCVIASDPRQCCTCGSSMPAVLLEADPCLVAEGEALPAAGECTCRNPVTCGACVPPPDVATCVIGDALNRCG
jgi:hypothetical protein